MTRHLWLLVVALLLAPVSVTAQSSLQFDGDDDRLQVPVFPEITGPLTVEAWIRPVAGGGGVNPRIVELVGNEDTSFRLMLGGDAINLPARPVFFSLHFSETGRQDVISPEDLSPGIWHHVAGVFTGDRQELYIDGNLVAFRVAAGTLNTNTVLDIGTGIRLTSDRDTFEGLIDEVRIWDHGRTQGEISATMFTELVGDELGLLGYWNLDEGSGQTAVDIANGHDALLGSVPHDPAWNLENAPINVAPRLACEGFDSPLNAGPVTLSKNRVLVFDAVVVDQDEVEITDADVAAPPVLQVTFSSGFPATPPTDITNDVPRSQKRLPSGNQFEYSQQTNGWRDSLKTDFYQAPGSYSIQMVSGDDEEYVIEPACEAIYVVQ